VLRYADKILNCARAQELPSPTNCIRAYFLDGGGGGGGTICKKGCATGLQLMLPTTLDGWHWW